MKLSRYIIFNGYNLRYNFNIHKIKFTNNDRNCNFDKFEVAPFNDESNNFSFMQFSSIALD